MFINKFSEFEHSAENSLHGKKAKAWQVIPHTHHKSVDVFSRLYIRNNFEKNGLYVK